MKFILSTIIKSISKYEIVNLTSLYSYINNLTIYYDLGEKGIPTPKTIIDAEPITNINEASKRSLAFGRNNIFILLSQKKEIQRVISKPEGARHFFLTESSVLIYAESSDFNKCKLIKYNFDLQEIVWESQSFDFCLYTYLFDQYFIFHKSHEDSILNCIDVETGRIYWQLDVSQYGPYIFPSPVKNIVIYENILLVPLISMTLLAIDISKGIVIWSSERAGGGTGIHLLENKILTFGAGITNRLEVHIINSRNGKIEQIIGLDDKLNQYGVIGSINYTYADGYLYVVPDRYGKHLITVFDITTWEIVTTIPIKIEWMIQKLQVMGRKLFVYDAAMILHIFEIK